MTAAGASDVLRVIEPNLIGPSGHYAEFVRALASRADGSFTKIEVVASPRAAGFLESLSGEVPVVPIVMPSGVLAETRAIRASLNEGRQTLVLTASASHVLLAEITCTFDPKLLNHLSFFVHWPLAKPSERLGLALGRRARANASFIVPTRGVRDALRAADCEHVTQVAYPATRALGAPMRTPFRHLLMAGAARINKGLDVVAELAEILAREQGSTDRAWPLLVQVSPKHIDRHGSREDATVARLLAAKYSGLVADPSAPDRSAYADRFRGALVLAPYERAKFANGVSGVVLDALLHGAPVVATEGTWAGDVVARFDAGIAIRERTGAQLSTAVARILARWDRYAQNAAVASEALAREHDPRGLARVIAAHRG